MARWTAVLAFAVAVWVGMATSALHARGRTEIVAKFLQPSLELDVATYVDPEVEAEAAGGKVGLLGFASGQVRNSFALRADDWNLLIDLWTRAVKRQSRTWRLVGSLTEKGSGDVSRLSMSAGQGVKIAITSAKGASMTYLVARTDMARFQAAINQVKEHLAQTSSP